MPGADRDEDSGKYTDKYPREEFVKAIRAEGGMAGTQDVADRVGVIYDTAYKKLRRLEEGGEVSSRKIANARVWMLPDE